MLVTVVALRSTVASIALFSMKGQSRATPVGLMGRSHRRELIGTGTGEHTPNKDLSREHTTFNFLRLEIHQ